MRHDGFGLPAVVAMGCAAANACAQWQPAAGRLTTAWTGDVDPSRPLPEYPRPQLVREEWANLNGLWDYAIEDRFAGVPERYEGQILVPFAIESALSGVKKAVLPEQALWYRRAFDAPRRNGDGRVLLHFGAVDWQADVFVNGRLVGSHAGGFDPFTFDITDALKPESEQELVVRAWDPTNTASQPRGKQVLNPSGIFYTAVTGIWQTVWLETVPRMHIRDLHIVPELADGRVRVTVHATGGAGDAAVELRVLADDREVAAARGVAGQPISIPLDDPRPWTPDDPFLYALHVTLRGGETSDSVRSYFGMRSIAVGKDEHGVNRLLLNGEPVFQYGPLDQGWWPDGLFTAPTDEALRFDIEAMKRMGFNTVRKHVKIEPARWYYWCDTLGLLVWQDMPSGMASGTGDRIAPGAGDDARLGAGVRAQFRRELKAMIDALRHHPSIVAWVPFNEGWGQHETNDVLQWTRGQDPSRLVNGPSGWEDRGVGDMKDMHNYPGPAMFPPMEGRASVLGEFGGLGLPVEGHLWRDSDNWGYRTYHGEDELRRHYDELVRKMRLLIRQGLAAAVYTQLTDVEGEINGLLSYDRKVEKLDAAWLKAVHAPLYEPAPPLELVELVATGEAGGQMWRYTTDAPADHWMQPGFDHGAWRSGEAPFGGGGAPGIQPRTPWETPDIWVRREFDFSGEPGGELYLRVYHDETATVYLNGVRVTELGGFNTRYELLPLGEQATAALRRGVNVLAIHCRQTRGGQGIDAGLMAGH